MIADLEELWRKSDWIPRFALLVAAVAALAHLASLLGAGLAQLSALVVGLQLAVVCLIFGIFTGNLRDLFRGSRRTYSLRGREPLPRRLVWLSLGLGLYALLWFGGLFAYYGDGASEVRNGMHVWVRAGEIVRQFTPAEAQWADARSLSAFSAAWVAAALPLAITYQRRKARRDLAATNAP
jgi:hypothetical protein